MRVNLNDVAINAKTLNGTSNYKYDRTLNVSIKPNTWYRVATLSSKPNVFINSLIFSASCYQNSQCTQYLFTFAHSFRNSKFMQIGGSDYPNNNTLKIRAVRESESKLHLEVYNGYKYSDTFSLVMNFLDMNNLTAILTPIEVSEQSEYTVESTITGALMP